MMTISVSKEWLFERGGLHDARARWELCAGSALRISIDNEWANEGLGLVDVRAGELVFDGASITPEDLATGEGWISEVRIDDLGRFVFDFCDRDRLTVAAAKGVWAPSVES